MMGSGMTIEFDITEGGLIAAINEPTHIRVRLHRGGAGLCPVQTPQEIQGFPLTQISWNGLE